jgi:hypothetical protein
MVFSLPFLPLGEPVVDQYVHSKSFEHPAIVADMAAWNALPYLTGLLPQYEILGRGDTPLALSDWEGMRVRAGGGLGAGWEISMFASPNAATTLLFSASTKIPPTTLTWRWNLVYGAFCYAVLVGTFALLDAF